MNPSSSSSCPPAPGGQAVALGPARTPAEKRKPGDESTSSTKSKQTKQQPTPRPGSKRSSDEADLPEVYDTPTAPPGGSSSSSGGDAAQPMMNALESVYPVLSD